jgi:IclR family transcriptional regulator, KDG regulon repressor
MSGPERTMHVLERVAAAQVPPSHTQLAEDLGIAKSTLSELLSALRRMGYVDSVERGYIPGPGLLALSYRLAPRASFDDGLRHRLRPTLEALAAMTGETVVLSVEIGGDESRAGFIFPIDHVESPSPLRFVPIAGEPQPLYRTAAGRVFLAFSGRSASSLPAASLVKTTDKTLVDPRLIDAELKRVRRQGYAVSIDETLEGLAAIAAPLLDGTERPMAAVSVFGPSQRLLHPDKAIGSDLLRMIAYVVPPPRSSQVEGHAADLDRA